MKSIPIHQMFRKAVLIPLFSIAFLSGTPYATAAQTSLSPKAELADGEYAIELSIRSEPGTTHGGRWNCLPLHHLEQPKLRLYDRK